MKKHLFPVLLAVLAAVTVKTAWGHYLWLEAIPVINNGQAQIDIDIRVGDSFPGKQLANDLRHYETFSVYQNGEVNEVNGHRGRKPAGWLNDGGEAFLTYYRSVPRNVRMGQNEFTQYLQFEGLKQALNQFQQTSKTAEVTETYTHHGILLVDGPQGFNIEVIPPDALLLLPDLEQLASNQAEAKTFRLSFAGQAIAGAPVTLSCPDQSIDEQRSYTSADGWVSFNRLCAGSSLLRAIHLQPGNEDASRWQSHWVTLTQHQGR